MIEWADCVVFTRRSLIMPTVFGNPVSSVMHLCLRLNASVRQTLRHTLSWRTARVFCAVWFTLTSVGLPMGLSSLGNTSCARSPGSQCRCSLSKRLSGTCCCSRDAQPQLVKSCCSDKKSAAKLSEPIASACCSSKAPAQELSIARCDCGSDSPESVSLNHEPRLPATSSVISVPETNVAFAVLPADRVESALLLPPVPPPKIVL